MRCSVELHSFEIEPWTVARLPFQAANHAELSATSARHVIASLFQLDHGRAVEASLPSFLLGDLGKFPRSFVLGAVPAGMPSSIAYATYFSPTTAASTVLTRTPTGSVLNMNIRRLDPFTTAFGGAVDAILSGIFLILLVPLLFEADIKELFNMF